MLLFEKVSYQDLIDYCRCDESIEVFIDLNYERIKQYSDEKNIPFNEICKQIRLQAPQFSKLQLRQTTFWMRCMVPVLDSVFNSNLAILSDYNEKCGVNTILNTESREEIIHIHKDGNTYYYLSESNYALEIKAINETMGIRIEENLHYLRSARRDALYRYGLFLKGYEYPICYASFCEVDREDKIQALQLSTNNPNITADAVIELARVYGCGKLPRNTISSFVSYVLGIIEKKYTYVITAVNIALGFTGNSVIASGFVPYALRPVQYYYMDRQYTTKRNCSREKERSKITMPPNILYVRQIRNNNKKPCFCKVVDIRQGYKPFETTVEHEIYEIRDELEKIWDEKTRYHGTLIDVESKNPISKGQCGVSSLLLARKLEKKGFDVSFCEGNLICPKRENSIENHCWVMIKNYNNRKKDVIVDITADQNGYSKKIIFSTDNELWKKGIRYDLQSEKAPLSVNVKHLLDRLVYLEKELQKKSEKENKNEQ